MDDIPFTQVLEQPPPTPGYQSQPPSGPKIPSGPSKPAKLGVSKIMNELCHELINKYNELVPLISRGLEISDSRHPVDHDFFLNHLKAIKEHINSYVVAGGRRRKTRRPHKKRKL